MPPLLADVHKLVVKQVRTGKSSEGKMPNYEEIPIALGSPCDKCVCVLGDERGVDETKNIDTWRRDIHDFPIEGIFR